MLDSVIKVIDFRGRTPKKLGMDWSENGYLALSALNVKDGYIDETIDAHYGNQELYDKWMKGNELHKGQVLFTTEAPMGNVAQVPDSKQYILSQRTIAFEVDEEFITENYLAVTLRSASVFNNLTALSSGGTAKGVSQKSMSELTIPIPKETAEQNMIGEYFQELDNLITLHQRKQINRKGEVIMTNEANRTGYFHEYYAKWIDVYKYGAVRKVTLDKYLMAHRWLIKLVPDMLTIELNRISYQKIINEYAESHEKQTVTDFHHLLKGAIMDAVDDGLIERDPTRKVIIKGKTPGMKKVKFLNQFQLHTLLANLNMRNEVNWDYFILLLAKTGIRFSEALAVTPADFDFRQQTLSISKTFDYKGGTGFLPTKNRSSIRKVQIDWQTVIQFSELIKGLPEEEPIFGRGRVYNSTINDRLRKMCKKCNIPIISVHGLRHTHASLLLFAGVSIASVARRLGHSNITTTQKTYLHIIKELENQDVDIVMRLLSGLS